MTGRLGIIGGGQLAFFMCDAARRLGVEVAVLAEGGDAPALDCADRPFRWDTERMEEVDEFLACCDVVTFDKEAIPERILARLGAAEEQGQMAVHPGASTLRMLKDKALQKTWLVQQGLPTLPFHIIPGNNLAPGVLTRCLGASLVQKARCGGYDGRGVQILAPLQSSRQLWNVPSIVEPYLPDTVEIAVIAARAQSGEIQVYPPVSMEFDAQLNSVRTVIMPAAITPAQHGEATGLARKALQALGGVGVFAIEMFLNAEGDLLINEISPRVHNSGHVTLDACNVSQFEQHVRAVLNLPLLPITTAAPAVMLNILYTPRMLAHCPPEPGAIRLPGSGSTVYWYGKTPGQEGRKMGHINAVGTGHEEALEAARGTLDRLCDKAPGRAA